MHGFPVGTIDNSLMIYHDAVALRRKDDFLKI